MSSAFSELRSLSGAYQAVQNDRFWSGIVATGFMSALGSV